MAIFSSIPSSLCQRQGGEENRLITLHPGNDSICTNSLPLPNNWISCLKLYVRGNIWWCLEQTLINSKWKNCKYLPSILSLFEWHCKEMPRTERQAVVLQVHHQIGWQVRIPLHSDCTRCKTWHQGGKMSSRALGQPGLALSTLVPPHFRSAEESNQPENRLTPNAVREKGANQWLSEARGAAEDTLVEVSGFTNSNAHADSRYPMWQRQHLERQTPIFMSQVYSGNPWQALLSIILIYIPIK